MRGATGAVLLTASVAVTLFFEWHTDEVTVVLTVMCLLAAGLGALKPQLAIVSGAAIGFSVFVAHAVSESMGFMRPHYVHAAMASGDWVAMALAGLFVTAVGWVSGRARSMVTAGDGLSTRGNP